MSAPNSYLTAQGLFAPDDSHRQLDHLLKVAANLQCPRLQHEIDYQAMVVQNYNIYSDLLDDHFFFQQQIKHKQAQIQELRAQAERQQKQDDFILDTQEDARIIRERLGQLEQQIQAAQETLTHKQFYREYSLMKKELEGLMKQNTNLKEIEATVKANLGM